MIYFWYKMRSMDDSRPFYRDPIKQIFIAIFIVIVAYMYLMGRQGSAVDVAYRDGYAYVAMGESWGVRVVDVRNPGSPEEVGHSSFLGAAQKVTLADHYLFVADGASGMRILDISNPNAPNLISTFSTPGDTRDIVVGGHYAYLAKGEAGLTIVDISDPAHPVEVKNIALPGSSNALQAIQVLTSLPPPTSGENPIQKTSIYLYVANGTRGLQVIDASLPTAPVVMGGVDTPGEALDLAVSGAYIYVADATAGLRVESIANPLQPVEISSFTTSGPAVRVSVNGPYVMLALGDQGLNVVNVANPSVPVKAMAYLGQGDIISTTGLGPYVLLAEGPQGMQVVNIGNAARPIVVSIYDTPGEASFLQVVQGLWGGVNLGLGDVHAKVWRTLLSMLGDLVLLLAGLLLWLSFYAQFSLPLHTIQDRINAVRLLVGYYTGERGPALFIENGKLVERQREETRIGRGVAVLDTASAAVFRTRHAFTRPAGPGIIFTHAGEYPAGVVDLHPQSISLGPFDRDGLKEDPFVGQADGEDDTQYRQRQAHRYETSGLTRDGVEVVPVVSVSFKLDSVPGEGKTGFGYDPQAVWNAIAGVGIKPEVEIGSDQRIVSWDWLPGHVAVDLWREYLRKYTLDELFVFSKTQNEDHNYHRKTAFDLIGQMVRARMTTEEVEEIDDTGHATGKKMHSRDYQILKERGIQILSVSIRSLHFPAEVEKQLVDQWFGTWLQRAQEEVRQSERIQAEEKNDGQELALKEYASASSQPLANALADDFTIDANKSLELLLQGTLKLCVRELELNPRLTNQKTSLVELVEWIRKQ
jgi:hypothetical protein